LYFSKVLYFVPLHSKYTRALTFENLCHLTQILQREVGAGGAGGAGGALGGREEMEGNGEGGVTSLKDEDKTKSLTKFKNKKASKDKTSKTKRKRLVSKHNLNLNLTP
jgi:hypothetical protein